MNSRRSQSGSKTSLIKTLTYFIPAPPARKSGYREVEFDKIMQGFLTNGFTVLDLKVEAVPSGVFIVALLKAKSKKQFDADLELDFHERFKLSHSLSSPDIILEDDDA